MLILGLFTTLHKAHGNTFPTSSFFLSMQSTPLESITDNMPSENSFKQHIERTRGALKNFNAIRLLDAPGPVKTALDELVANTVDFTKFIPFFTSHPMFLEIPPAVHSALEDFFDKNPSFEKPANYKVIIGLNARARESSKAAAKRGVFPLLLYIACDFSESLSRSHLLAAVIAANLRPEKTKKAKASANVSFFIFFIYFYSFNALRSLRINVSVYPKNSSTLRMIVTIRNLLRLPSLHHAMSVGQAILSRPVRRSFLPVSSPVSQLAP